MLEQTPQKITKENLLQSKSELSQSGDSVLLKENVFALE